MHPHRQAPGLSQSCRVSPAAPSQPRIGRACNGNSKGGLQHRWWRSKGGDAPGRSITVSKAESKGDAVTALDEMDGIMQARYSGSQTSICACLDNMSCACMPDLSPTGASSAHQAPNEPYPARRCARDCYLRQVTRQGIFRSMCRAPRQALQGPGSAVSTANGSGGGGDDWLEGIQQQGRALVSEMAGLREEAAAKAAALAEAERARARERAELLEVQVRAGRVAEHAMQAGAWQHMSLCVCVACASQKHPGVSGVCSC